MTIYQPYVYIIRWSNANKGYIGVRFAQKCNPSDLFVSYHTSSKVVKHLISEVGLPDQIKIFPYPDKETALLMEEKFQRRFRVLESDYWLNKVISKSLRFHTYRSGKDHHKYDSEIYYLLHDNGTRFVGTRYDFISHTGIQKCHSLFNGSEKSINQWRLCDSNFRLVYPINKGNPKSIPKSKRVLSETERSLRSRKAKEFFERNDTKIYHLIKKDNQTFIGTKTEFRTKFDYPRNVSRLFNGQRKSYKGWKIQS